MEKFNKQYKQLLSESEYSDSSAIKNAYRMSINTVKRINSEVYTIEMATIPPPQIKLEDIVQYFKDNCLEFFLDHEEAVQKPNIKYIIINDNHVIDLKR